MVQVFAFSFGVPSTTLLLDVNWFHAVAPGTPVPARPFSGARSAHPKAPGPGRRNSAPGHLVRPAPRRRGCRTEGPWSVDRGSVKEVTRGDAM